MVGNVRLFGGFCLKIKFTICRNCGDMGKGICGRQGAGEKIVYAWGRNAPDLKLPSGRYKKLISSTCLHKVYKFVMDSN